MIAVAGGILLAIFIIIFFQPLLKLALWLLGIAAIGVVVIGIAVNADMQDKAKRQKAAEQQASEAWEEMPDWMKELDNRNNR